MAPVLKTLVKARDGVAATATAATVVARAASTAAARPVLRPQAPLQQAVNHAASRNAPSGLGVDSADVRARMVDRLRAGGIQNESVLAAMARNRSTMRARTSAESTPKPEGALRFAAWLTACCSGACGRSSGRTTAVDAARATAVVTVVEAGTPSRALTRVFSTGVS